jgi:hypothetical protein
MDEKRLQNKSSLFNMAGSILVSENPETERGMAIAATILRVEDRKQESAFIRIATFGAVGKRS